MVPAGLMKEAGEPDRAAPRRRDQATGSRDHRRARGWLGVTDRPTRSRSSTSPEPPDMSGVRTRRAGVIGSGVAGLTSAYVISGSAEVTLFEADDRLGGHADTHLVPTAAGPVAIDTGFIVHNERTYPTLLRLFRRARGAHPAVGHVDVGPLRRRRARVRRRAGRARAVPDLAQPHPAGVPADADGGAPVPPAGAAAAGVGAGRARRRPRPDARGVPRGRPLLGVLPPALHDASGRRGLVLRPRGRPGVPGSLPLRVPAPPRDAGGLRLAAVAYRHRRVARVRRPTGRRAGPPRRHDRGRHQGDLGARDAARGRGDRRQRHGAPLRRRRDRDPPGAGARPAGRAHRGPARGADRDAVLEERRPAAHRHLAAPPASPGAGLVEPPRAPGHRRRHGHLRPDPADGPAPRPGPRHSLPGHPRRSGPRRPGHGDRHPALRAPALHAGVGRRPAPQRRARQRSGRVRRRVAGLGLPRGRRPVRSRRGRAARVRLAVGPRARRAPPGSTPPRSRTPAASR